MQIDLHIHTTHSDGTETPKEIIKQAIKSGIEIISFTDHDSVGAYADLGGIRPDNLTIINGVELSFIDNNNSKHMLGYGIDLNVIQKFLDSIHSPKQNIKRQTTCLNKFSNLLKSKGFKIDDNLEIKTGNTSEAYQLCYNSISSYPENVEKFPFIACGRTKFYWDYFNNPNSEFFIGQNDGLPNMKEVIDVIHNAGGLAFIAHPFYYNRDIGEVNRLIDEAIKNNVDGIEVKHSSNQGNDVEYLTKIATNNGLFICGGSDYHGLKSKPEIKLGTGKGNIMVDFNEISNWFDKIKKRS